MDITTVAIFVVCLILFKLVVGVVTGPNKFSWLACIALAAVVTAIIVYHQEELQGVESMAEETEAPEVVMQTEPINYRPQSVSLNGRVPDLEPITWKDFKLLATSSEFADDLAQAIEVSRQIKLERYKRMRSGAKTFGLFSGDKTKSELDSIIKSLKGPIRVRLDRAVNIGESLVGREDVKDFLAQQIIAFSNNPHVFLNNFQNICIFGPSGIGKTKLANTISEVYLATGILSRNNFVSTTKADFTTAYVNESGTMTRNALMRGLEGVTFIDEAYDIVQSGMRGEMRDHGEEAVTEMVNFLDKTMGLSIVIASGYEGEMRRRFLGANEGMDRRFFYKISLKEYNNKELYIICKRFLEMSGISVNKKQGSYLWGCIKAIYDENPEVFSKQGSDMLSLSGEINRIMFSTKSVVWSRDYKKIISRAITSFSSLKGYEIVPDT